VSYLPLDEIRGKASVNLAPMIDFLFLMLAFFASLALSRAAVRETEVELVQIAPETEARAPVEPAKIVELLLTEEGDILWATDLRSYPLGSAAAVAAELEEQIERGLLPADRTQTKLLLKIDAKAQWEPIVELIFAVRDAGFSVRPVYEPLVALSDDNREL